MQTKITKKYKIKRNITGFLSLVCTFFPILFFGVQAFREGVIIGEKATMDMTFLIIMTAVAGIMVLIGIFRKCVFRSIPYFMILGIYFLIDTIVPVIITLAICTIIDEIVLTPLYNYYRQKVSINKEIDKRGTV